jgi:hypothetical protein
VIFTSRSLFEMGVSEIIPTFVTVAVVSGMPYFIFIFYFFCSIYKMTVLKCLVGHWFNQRAVRGVAWIMCLILLFIASSAVSFVH